MKFNKYINFNRLLVLVIIVVTWVNFNQERWKSKNVIVLDVLNYYSYLPAFFYEKDITLSFLQDSVQKSTNVYYTPNHTPDNKAVIKMSMGMAFTYLPFFGMAHVYSKLTGIEANGFTEPYHFAILFSTLLYYIIGLIFLFRVLRLYFSETLSCMVLFCITFGTNILFYLTIMTGLTHTTDFALVAIFLYYTIKWHKQPSLKNALLIALAGGMLTLIRPINILVFLVFILFGIKNFNDLKSRGVLFISKGGHILLMTLVGCLIFLPQLLYWKHVTGHYFFNSYVNEHFYFNNPHVFKALFSFRKGWLIYTPIMFFSLAGILYLKNNLKDYFITIIAFMVIYLYVTFSWWCWWYGGSFSQRVLIDIYPLLAIPFALFLTQASNYKLKYRNTVYTVAVLLVLLNLFQTVQAKYNIIHFDSMTRENYVRVFFTITKQADRENYLKHPDIEKALKGEDEDD